MSQNLPYLYNTNVGSFLYAKNMTNFAAFLLVHFTAHFIKHDHHISED